MTEEVLDQRGGGVMRGKDYCAIDTFPLAPHSCSTSQGQWEREDEGEGEEG